MTSSLSYCPLPGHKLKIPKRPQPLLPTLPLFFKLPQIHLEGTAEVFSHVRGYLELRLSRMVRLLLDLNRLLPRHLEVLRLLIDDHRCALGTLLLAWLLVLEYHSLKRVVPEYHSLKRVPPVSSKTLLDLPHQVYI